MESLDSIRSFVAAMDVLSSRNPAKTRAKEQDAAPRCRNGSVGLSVSKNLFDTLAGYQESSEYE